MSPRFAFAFFAIFYPFRYFLIVVLCLSLTFWHFRLRPIMTEATLRHDFPIGSSFLFSP